MKSTTNGDGETGGGAVFSTFHTLRRFDTPRLEPDCNRLIIRSFIPNTMRIARIIRMVADLDEDAIQELLSSFESEFGARRDAIFEHFAQHCAIAQDRLRESGVPADSVQPLSKAASLLAGAYFSSKYAFEAAALFNPSIVMSPDQSDLPQGALRFIMSARSVGEGHVSSISFRQGVVDADGNVSVESVGRLAAEGRKTLPNQSSKNFDALLPWLLPSVRNYETQFDACTKLAERLLFPVSAIEQNGIEDARFVRFTDGGGAARYYATYTAYDGKNILSQLLETDDFLHFAMRSLSGGMTANKGLALFPRKIGGRHQPDAPHQPDARYAMLARTDGENIYIMFSNDLYTWNEGTLLAAPQYPWEFMQLGNCGSPIEIDEGWLVLTHGVGLVRTYSIGALLLDKDDPATVIGMLPEPLIVPGEQEQGGYVPGVVYTCGALLHQGRLIIPYGSADRAIAFASVAVKELVENMR